MVSRSSSQKSKKIALLFTEKLHFWIKLLKSEFYQNGRMETSFRYVAKITTLRETTHACFSILASIVRDKLMDN